MGAPLVSHEMGLRPIFDMGAGKPGRDRRLKLPRLRDGGGRRSLASSKMETFMMVAAVLGVLGRKLPGEGKLDPYFAGAI